MTFLWILLVFYLGGAFVASFSIKAVEIDDRPSARWDMGPNGEMTPKRPTATGVNFMATMLGALCWPLTLIVASDVDDTEL